MRICTKDPQEMAPAERFAEVTDILAKAAFRMEESKQNQGNERSLAGLQNGSKRSCLRENNSNKVNKREV